MTTPPQQERTTHQPAFAGQPAVLAGFGIRLLASLLDLLWMLPLSWLLVGFGAALHEAAGGGGSATVVIGPGGYPTPAAEAMLNLVFALIILNFWVSRQATPGKRALRLRIVDAETGGHAPPGRLVLRYVGYLVSALPLGLGYLWMLWDRRRQTWQDKLGGTLVVRDPPPPSTAGAG